MGRSHCGRVGHFIASFQRLLHACSCNAVCGRCNHKTCLKTKVNILCVERFFVQGDSLWKCLKILFRLNGGKDISLQSISSAGLRQSIGSVFEHAKTASDRSKQSEEHAKEAESCLGDVKNLLKVSQIHIHKLTKKGSLLSCNGRRAY